MTLRVCGVVAHACLWLQRVMRTLAGNLVQLRAQRDRMIGVKANLTAAGYRTSVGASAGPDCHWRPCYTAAISFSMRLPLKVEVAADGLWSVAGVCLVHR